MTSSAAWVFPSIALANNYTWTFNVYADATVPVCSNYCFLTFLQLILEQSVLWKFNAFTLENVTGGNYYCYIVVSLIALIWKGERDTTCFKPNFEV